MKLLSRTRTGRADRKAALAFIYVTIVLDTLGFGITIPVLPHLIENFTGDTASAAAMNGLFLTVWGLMQFLFSPLLGALSDRFGRRPVLILSSFGLGLDYIVMALAPNLSFLLLGRILSGITASSYPTAGAYVADVTPVERRAAAFGMIGAAWGIGFIFGPAVGGLLGVFGSRVPFWTAAVFSIVSASYGLFVLPESLSRASRHKFTWRRASPIGSLALLRSRRDLLGLGVVNFVQFLGFQVLPSIFVLYADFRLGWKGLEVGATLALVGALNITVQGGLVKRFIKRYGERTALIVGLLFGTTALVVWGLATDPVLMVLATFLFAPIGFAQPALQSLMTRRVGPSEQGQLQGANASIGGLTGIVGPILFGLIFARSIPPGGTIDLPGLAFFVAAVLMLLSVVVAVRVTHTAAEAIRPAASVALPDRSGPTQADPIGSSVEPIEPR